MAFRKQIPEKPAPTVRAMVTMHGDDWHLFCAAHPISNPVWWGDRGIANRLDAYIMKECEKGKRDRVDEWDMKLWQNERPPVHVEHVYPPIPERNWDYAAYRDPEGPIGCGPTRFAAINDLIEQESEQ